jgi:predicted porin
MNFKLAAVAAAAAMAGAAHAQSSVTLYGMVDAGILWQSTATATYYPGYPLTGGMAKSQGGAVRMQSGGMYPSLWGIKAREDLGGGWAALAQLQGSFNITNGKSDINSTLGGTGLFNMISTVGLTNENYGTLTIGRQFSPFYTTMMADDGRHNMYFGSMLTALLGVQGLAGWVGGSSNCPLGTVEDDNALVYVSPTVYGFKTSLEYAMGGVAGSFKASSRQAAVLQYDGYGLRAAVSYYNANDTNPNAGTAYATPYTANFMTGTPSSGVSNNRVFMAQALYSIDKFTVGGGYANLRDPSRLGKVSFDVYTGSLAYQFNPALSVSAATYYIKDNNTSSNRSQSYVLGVVKALSKSTMLYADVGYVDNRGYLNQGLAYGQPVAPGRSTTSAIVGMRHMF